VMRGCWCGISLAAGVYGRDTMTFDSDLSSAGSCKRMRRQASSANFASRILMSLVDWEAGEKSRVEMA